MKLNELEQERVSKIERMVVINNIDKLSEVESAEFARLENEVKDLDKQIERKKEVEKLSMSVGINRTLIQPVSNEPFSITKFLRESLTHNLTGAELEAANRGRDLFDRSGSISGYALPFDVMFRASDTNLTWTNQLKELSVIKSPAQSVVEQLGVKVLTGINGKYDLPYMNQFSATFLGEGVAGSGATFTTGKATLSPRALQTKLILSQEWLNQTSPQIQAGIQQDILDSIWRGLFKDLLSQIIANTSVTSGATLTTGFTYQNCINLQSLVADISALDNAAYVTNYTEMAILKGQIKSGSTTNFTAEYTPGLGLNINGLRYIPTALQGTKNLLFGDFRYAAIGLFGQSFDLFIDRSGVNADNHQLSLYVTAMADTKVINPGAFAYFTKS